MPSPKQSIARPSARPEAPQAIASIDELATIDVAMLGGVTGGAGSDMSSMMPMMMMMMNQRHQAPQQVIAAAPASTGFTVNGVQQSPTLGADGSYNYTSEG